MKKLLFLAALTLCTHMPMTEQIDISSNKSFSKLGCRPRHRAPA